ncbi:hypothetical protein [Pseudochrobactrum sp. MP213Fo]|uniref:hypothetical protein n=1 Tax=Pseudochrobactrum sp. MP213Fo TaxID=3022250 RepID=UPI003BA0D678
MRILIQKQLHTFWDALLNVFIKAENAQQVCLNAHLGPKTVAHFLGCAVEHFHQSRKRSTGLFERAS